MDEATRIHLYRNEMIDEIRKRFESIEDVDVKPKVAIAIIADFFATELACLKSHVLQENTISLLDLDFFQ